MENKNSYVDEPEYVIYTDGSYFGHILRDITRQIKINGSKSFEVRESQKCRSEYESLNPLKHGSIMLIKDKTIVMGTDLNLYLNELEREFNPSEIENFYTENYR